MICGIEVTLAMQACLDELGGVPPVPCRIDKVRVLEAATEAILSEELGDVAHVEASELGLEVLELLLVVGIGLRQVLVCDGCEVVAANLRRSRAPRRQRDREGEDAQHWC